MEQRTRQSVYPATRRPDLDEGISSMAPDPAEAHDSDATDASKSSSPLELERLPAELRDQILLSAPDLPTLRALVHASPVMHAQYRHNRDMLLRTCVGRELDGCFVDAHACLKSRAGTMGPFRINEKITKLLDAYRGWLSDSGPHADLGSVSPSSVRWLAGFHLSVVRPVSRSYGAWALANLALATASSPAPGAAESTATTTAAAEAAVAAEAGDQDITLSRSEETRVFRALYRHETYCHLFGRNKAKRRGGFRRAEINEIFFGLFDPWDAEAVGCIDAFVRQKYIVIFREISEELRPESPRFRKADGSVDPEGSFDLDTSSEYINYMDGTVARGLGMTVRLLAIEDHDTLVNKMQRCLTRHYAVDAPMQQVLWSSVQKARRDLIGTNVRDAAEQRRDRIEFAGDAVPPAGPPLAWVLLWNGIYANVYGGYVPSTVRQWGYVMWDERRWADLGATGLISKQWETAPDQVEEIERDYGWRPIP